MWTEFSSIDDGLHYFCGTEMRCIVHNLFIAYSSKQSLSVSDIPLRAAALIDI